jgi:CheY-like chemotaxis protein
MGAARVILVVEEHPELRQVLRDTFAADGYEVLMARDWQEGEEVLRTQVPALLVADLAVAPGTTTREQIIRRLRQDFPQLPMVVLDEGEFRHPEVYFGSERKPGYRVLAKPFRLRDLILASRDVVGQLEDIS